ncbi:LacI family DNA-binding transcriptional regulator [Paenibacillaceae bacterium WGS1546]|uniref:LacI family DNA-binding transcriptional regulator n=1 Tax=Cohnella sp. WGS1546 TaxID=3366810 RepID=UPI00372CF1F7
MGKVGIKDIAERANVSTATVSYVLNGTRNVKPKTRERVLKVIEELNYTPNAIAKSLKSNRTDTIGVIAEDVTVFNVPEIIDGINQYADRHDLHILLTNLRLHRRVGHRYGDMDKYRSHAENAVADLLSKQVEGIVYIGVHPRDVTGLIDARGKPIVFTYCYTQNDVSIQYNDEQASFDAMKYLTDKGHRRIGIISGPMDSLPSRHRFNGYFKAVTMSELPFDTRWIKVGDWGLESGYAMAKELLALDAPPTAILVMNDIMAVGATRAAFEMGVSIPDELSIVGFDNRELSEYVTPRLTTMNLPLHQMGYSSMEALTSLIRGERPQADISPLCTLIERDTVASLA